MWMWVRVFFSMHINLWEDMDVVFMAWHSPLFICIILSSWEITTYVPVTLTEVLHDIKGSKDPQMQTKITWIFHKLFSQLYQLFCEQLCLYNHSHIQIIVHNSYPLKIENTTCFLSSLKGKKCFNRIRKHIPSLFLAALFWKLGSWMIASWVRQQKQW